MYAPHSHRLVDTRGCLVENEAANQVVQAIRSIMLKYDMQPYDEDTGQGFIRHAVIRVGHASGEMLVTIVTNGEVIAPDQDFVAIGSGGNYAYSAANALFNHTDMAAEDIVRESLRIASSICVYTNDHITVEKLGGEQDA